MSNYLKEYLAIVEKKEIADSGILIDKLVKSSTQKKSFISETSEAKESRLQYTVLHTLDQYLLLTIKLTTGRFHQIRSQLSNAGIPVRGDVKYGARRKNKDRSIGLHSWKVIFTHPSTNQKLEFKAELPENDIWPIINKMMSATI
jgi:23S rRNA pseudouridine1911/1915/1917 synthase